MAECVAKSRGDGHSRAPLGRITPRHSHRCPQYTAHDTGRKASLTEQCKRRNRDPPLGSKQTPARASVSNSCRARSHANDAEPTSLLFRRSFACEVPDSARENPSMGCRQINSPPQVTRPIGAVSAALGPMVHRQLIRGVGGFMPKWQAKPRRPSAFAAFSRAPSRQPRRLWKLRKLQGLRKIMRGVDVRRASHRVLALRLLTALVPTREAMIEKSTARFPVPVRTPLGTRRSDVARTS